MSGIGSRFRTIAAVVATLGALVATAASDSDSSDDDKKAGIGQGKSKDATPSGPKMTVSQENAVDSAKGYLTMGSGFSYQGLIDQLSSSAGDGYSKKDAKFAVDYLNVKWNKQAVQAAKGYLDMSSFSCAGLVDQLSSPAGNQFTKAQATYAAKKVGLC